MSLLRSQLGGGRYAQASKPVPVAEAFAIRSLFRYMLFSVAVVRSCAKDVVERHQGVSPRQAYLSCSVHQQPKGCVYVNHG